MRFPQISSSQILTLCRFAEMEKSEKNKISHRSLALAKLRAWFKEQTAVN